MSTKRLSGEDALGVLTKYSQAIWRVGSIPFQRYLHEYPNQTVHLPRTRANIVNDLTVFQAMKEFDTPGIVAVEVSPPSTRTLFEIDKKILLRVKMMNAWGRTRNVATSFIKEYEADQELPGIPARPHRMTLGYVPDHLQTSVSQVMVASHIKGKLEFYITFALPNVVSMEDTRFLGGASSSTGNVEVKLIYQRRLTNLA